MNWDRSWFSYVRVGFRDTRFLAALIYTSASLLLAPVASAALINFSGTSSDGHPISGTADFALDAAADTVTVVLTNTTATTHDAGELFTGIDFMLGGLTPTLSSDTGVRRTVAGDGTFSNTGAPQDLSWSLVSLGGGTFQLNFNPDAKDAIIGPPSAGVYVGNGSINGNPGHNPFAAETATFVLSVPDLEADTPVAVNGFFYGTDLDPMVIPEPGTWFLLTLAGLLAMLRRRK